MKEYTNAAKSFYRSRAWLKCRGAYIASVQGLCERCRAKGLIVPGYIVHHKRYIDLETVNNPEVTLNFDNLEYLCLECHNKEHLKSKGLNRYSVGEDGTVEIF